METGRPVSKTQSSPSQEHIATLEPFERIALEHILVASTLEEIERARRELGAVTVLGFDTESKPIFHRGQESDGPHVVQFSTCERAYIFQLHRPECHAVVVAILESQAIAKVGFGLSSDRKGILRKLQVHPKNVVDLNTLFKKEGYHKSVGVKGAVALVFNRRFLKSKKAATSNWANVRLTDTQVLYAANDAYAAVRVFHQMSHGTGI